MKPFECGTCGQAFARRERLKHHIERNHQLIGGMGVGQQQVSASHPVPSTTPASVMSESHHSNMARYRGWIYQSKFIVPLSCDDTQCSELLILFT